MVKTGSKGMQCVQFVTLLIQSSVPALVEQVATYQDQGGSWVSDKHQLPGEDECPDEQYRRYQALLRSDLEYIDLRPKKEGAYKTFTPSKKPPRLEDPSCLRSIECWQGEGSAYDFLTSDSFPLRLDAKITTPSALYGYLKNNMIMLILKNMKVVGCI